MSYSVVHIKVKADKVDSGKLDCLTDRKHRQGCQKARLLNWISKYFVSWSSFLRFGRDNVIHKYSVEMRRILRWQLYMWNLKWGPISLLIIASIGSCKLDCSSRLISRDKRFLGVSSIIRVIKVRYEKEIAYA